MNRHTKRERWTSVPILYRITLQNASYMDFKLLLLTSFEVAATDYYDSQEPACCFNSHLLGFLLKWVQTYSYLIRRVLEAPNSAEDGTN